MPPTYNISAYTFWEKLSQRVTGVLEKEKSMPSATISRSSQVGQKPDLALVSKSICKAYLVLSGLKRQLTKLEKLLGILEGRERGTGEEGRKEGAKKERKEGRD